jgi:hypothetical protein
MVGFFQVPAREDGTLLTAVFAIKKKLLVYKD